MKNVLFSVFSLLILTSCGNQTMGIIETVKRGDTAITTGAPGFDAVKPIFQAKCGSCHNGVVHPLNWTNYDVAKNNLKNINNRLFIVGNMPQGGSLSASEKQIIKDWIAAGGPLKGSAPVEPQPLPVPVPKPGTPESGKYLVETKCLGCHGSGASGMDTPLLHGQDKAYLVKQINDFKSGDRPDTMMNAMKSQVEALSDVEIDDIASHLSTQAACSITIEIKADGGDIVKGQEKAQACLGCHNIRGFAPVLTGQKTGYLKANILNFKNDVRKNDTMKAMVANLTDEDINDISAYLNSMRDCK